jgi:hypothetical protein
MAKGFESKDIEHQQAEAVRERATRHTLTPAERDDVARRRSIELSLTRSRSDLSRATSSAHRRMLEQAIAELERQLTHA